MVNYFILSFAMLVILSGAVYGAEIESITYNCPNVQIYYDANHNKVLEKDKDVLLSALDLRRGDDLYIPIGSFLVSEGNCAETVNYHCSNTARWSITGYKDAKINLNKVSSTCFSNVIENVELWVGFKDTTSNTQSQVLSYLVDSLYNSISLDPSSQYSGSVFDFSNYGLNALALNDQLYRSSDFESYVRDQLDYLLAETERVLEQDYGWVNVYCREVPYSTAMSMIYCSGYMEEVVSDTDTADNTDTTTDTTTPTRPQISYVLQEEIAYLSWEEFFAYLFESNLLNQETKTTLSVEYYGCDTEPVSIASNANVVYISEPGRYECRSAVSGELCRYPI